MKNLFIMHTQYNLILAASVLPRYKNAENTLVLYAEFAVDDEMRNAISKVFDRVIVVRDRFYAPTSALDEIREVRQLLKKVRFIRRERFDNIFMSQERIFDLILCRSAKRKNPDINCSNIEEDAYYSINEVYNADDFVYTMNWRMKRRRFLYRLLLAEYPYNYREGGYCYGMNSEYHGANLLFPNLARKELQSKTLVEITKEELSAGIQTLYSYRKTAYPESKKCTLIFFDLMSRYKDPERVKNIVLQVIKTSREEGRTVLLKYHPRETEKFTNMEGVVELPHIIPAEKILLDLKNTDTVVLGNATTACVVAAKLGFIVVSISKIEFPTNKKIHDIMSQMGIYCIEDVCEMNEKLKGAHK